MQLSTPSGISTTAKWWCSSEEPWQSHGVARARLVLRHRARPGAGDDRHRSAPVETAQMADFHLQVGGTDAWCVAALVAVLVRRIWSNMNG